jgi:hypothetical protein
MQSATPRKMQTVRGYFDQVFEGSYAKGIPEGKKAAIVSETDDRYTEETGQPPNREVLLWKTLRNIVTTDRFPDLWDQFRDDLSAGGISKTVVEQPQNPKDNVLENPTDAKVRGPEHTGHGTPERVDMESKGFDVDAAPRVPNDTGHKDAEDPAVTNVFTAKEGEIPGVDIPFRKVNPKYPANQVVLGEMKSLQERAREYKGYDCSEIAEDLLKVAKGEGQIIEVLPSGEREDLTLYEFGKRQDGFDYHQVYTDGRYVYDPRLSLEPIPKGDWEIMIRSLNPGATFNNVKMR